VTTLSDTRTSRSAYLTNSAAEASLMHLLHERVGAVTGMPWFNNDVQFLAYEKEQLFKTHHDGQNRVYTMLVYLSDVDEDAGGTTTFPALTPPLRVRPRAGTAVGRYASSALVTFSCVLFCVAF
jgi:hypothetical protein